MARTPLDLYETLLKPLSPIVAQMEIDGIRLDTTYAKELKSSYEKKRNESYRAMVKSIGMSFDYRSSKDLIYIIEHKLGLMIERETKKKNKSIDDASITELSKKDERLKPLVEIRHYDKMISTYIDGPISGLRPDGRVSPSWDILGTETGRWTSHKPFAIQTLPRDKNIKKLVIPEEGYVFVVCDYSQAELRILAYYSGDEWLRRAAINNEDLHAYSASLFFDTTPEKMIEDLHSKDPKIKKEAKEKRQIAKSGNFLCVYRGNDFALGKLLGISQKEAKKLQEKFFAKAVEIMKWSDTILNFMKKNGYVISCYGRIRRFPLYSYYSDFDKQKAEKEAANSVIQGTSADFCNYSILETMRELAKAGFIKEKRRVKIIAQIYDSAVFEVPEDWVDMCKIIIKNSMETPKHPVDIPMLVEMKTGLNYGDTEC